MEKEVAKPKRVLIATFYNPEPVLLASTKLGPDKVILLLDKDPDAEQAKALKLIQDSLGKVIEIVPVKMDMYDVVEIATKCVALIDSLGKDDIVYANITAGRKTKAIGLLFACYARHERVKKIAYNPHEDKGMVVYLPRLSFRLSESEKMVLEALDKGKFGSVAELAKKVKLSTAMLYRCVDELKDKDMVSTEEGIRLTDAGRIARL